MTCAGSHQVGPGRKEQGEAGRGPGRPRPVQQGLQGQHPLTNAVGLDSTAVFQLSSSLWLSPHSQDVPILVGDAGDSQSMGQVLSKTKVVISTAGPFALYGDKVLEQCVEQGTHYCDITGEVPKASDVECAAAFGMRGDVDG